MRRTKGSNLSEEESPFFELKELMHEEDTRYHRPMEDESPVPLNPKPLNLNP